MITKGTKIRLKHDVGNINAGKVFTVDCILPNGTITINSENGGCGIITMSDVDNLFIVIHPRKWTPWMNAHNEFGEYWYRHNRHETQVELWNGIRGRAFCAPGDDFSKQIGIDIAMRRAIRKFKVEYDIAFINRYGDEFATI